MRHKSFYSFFEKIDKLKIKYVIDFSLFLLSIDENNLKIINDFLILAKHKVMKLKRISYSRCSAVIEKFSTMYIICIVKIFSKNRITQILNNMPMSLKEYEKYYNKIGLFIATPDLKKIKIMDITKSKKLIKYTKNI